MTIQIRPAARHKARLRLALDGPSKSGKTLTALRLAASLGKRTLVLEAGEDTVDLYAGLEYDGERLAYDVGKLPSTGPDDYTAAINQGAAAGYDVLVVDGISPAWSGPGGMLELHDRVGGKNGWADWLKVNPMHHRMMAALKSYPGHVIVTLRSVTDWVIEKNAKGQDAPRKIGLKPQQRPMLEYEFDLLGSMDVDHVITITGSRCPGFDGATAVKPGRAFWLPLIGWLETGADVAPVDRVAMITDVQMHWVLKAFRDLGVAEAAMWARISRQYQCSTLGILTKVQAGELVDQLRVELARLPIAQATDHTHTTPAVAPQSPPAGGAPATLQDALAATSGTSAAPAAASNGQADHTQQNYVAALDSYFSLASELQGRSPYTTAERTEMSRKMLSKRGVPPLAPPPVEVMRELTETLERRVAEMTEQRRASGVTCAAGGPAGTAASPKS